MVVHAAKTRSGFAVVEWIVAVALLFLLAGLSARLISRLTHFGFSQLRAAAWAQEAGLAARVLGGELRRGRAGVDWVVHPGDSVSLRAFRGTGWICGRAGSPSRLVTVVFTGDRLPNPAKDSVLVVGAAGGPVLNLRRRWRRGNCPGVLPSRVEEWDIGPAAPSEAVLRLFESGSYSVHGGALRYRVGRGGRQPVVGSTFDTTSTLSPTSMGVPGGEGAALVIHSPAGPYGALPAFSRSVARARRSPR